MKRAICWSALVMCVLLLAPALRADVKTEEKTTFKLEGMMGAMLNRMAGGSDGISSSSALKGNRMARLNGTTGEIIDLTEQKVYNLDMKKKEYKVVTFAEMRKQLEDAKAQAAKQQQQMKSSSPAQSQDAGKQYEFDVDVKDMKDTPHKTLAGHDAHLVVMTLTMREKGKKLEESGGMVMTNSMWITPRVAVLDELNEFNMKSFQAVYGGMFTGMDMQQMTQLSAMIPGIGSLGEHMATEGRKMQGTSLSTTSVIETVKSADDMKGASQQSSGGGGIGGMLARRMNRGQGEQRTTTLTTSHDTLSIATSVAADDVAIPAGFKEKK